jgi:hypothetical protein
MLSGSQADITTEPVKLRQLEDTFDDRPGERLRTAIAFD